MSLLSKPSKSKSRRQEDRLAKNIGGKRTPGSGNKGIKGDVQNREVMAEAKTTSKTQHTVKLRDLEKLETEAHRAGKRPIYVIRMADDSPVLLLNPEWVLMPMNDYLALIGDDDE